MELVPPDLAHLPERRRPRLRDQARAPTRARRRWQPSERLLPLPRPEGVKGRKLRLVRCCSLAACAARALLKKKKSTSPARCFAMSRVASKKTAAPKPEPDANELLRLKIMVRANVLTPLPSLRLLAVSNLLSTPDSARQNSVETPQTTTQTSHPRATPKVRGFERGCFSCLVCCVLLCDVGLIR